MASSANAATTMPTTISAVRLVMTAADGATLPSMSSWEFMTRPLRCHETGRLHDLAVVLFVLAQVGTQLVAHHDGRLQGVLRHVLFPLRGGDHLHHQVGVVLGHLRRDLA